MNEIIKAIILGIIEGITEFLPISSTGHLILANIWINFSDKEFSDMFKIVIQLGAIISVIIYFWERLYPFSANKTPAQTKETYYLWTKAIVGVIPAMILGLLFDDVIEAYLFNPYTVATMLFIGGAVLIWLENKKKTSIIKTIKDMSYLDAVKIGLFQCIAMVPGTSRSAATIIGAMLIGTSRNVAAEFSFFLAIPTMFAASVYKLLKNGMDMTSAQWAVLGVGFVVSFLVAWGVIAVFMNYIRKNDFKFFGYYRIILGIIILVLGALGFIGK